VPNKIILNSKTLYPDSLENKKAKENVVCLDGLHSYTVIIPKEYTKRHGFETIKDIDIKFGNKELNITLRKEDR
jgi:hypothetical protein